MTSARMPDARARLTTLRLADSALAAEEMLGARRENATIRLALARLLLPGALRLAADLLRLFSQLK